MTTTKQARAARFDIRALLAFAAIALVAVPFALLLALVRSEFQPLIRLDQDVAEDVHVFALEHSSFTTVMHFISDSGQSVVWWIVLGAVFVWLLTRRLTRLAHFVAITAVGSFLLNLAIKTAVDRARPELPDALVHAAGKSFPSGHTQAAVVGYGILLLVFLPVVRPSLRKLVIALAVLMMALMGFSRVALGAHFLSDVIGAAIIGAAWLLGMTAAFSAWRRESGKPPVHVTEGLEPEDAEQLKPHVHGQGEPSVRG